MTASEHAQWCKPKRRTIVELDLTTLFRATCS